MKSLHSALKGCLALVLGLPLVQATLLWVARGLLAALGDEAAAAVLDRINLGVGVAWILSLIGLVVLLALRALEQSGELFSEDG